jgi:hypothetical protein
VWGFLDTLIAIPAQGLFFLLTPPVLGYVEWALLAVWLLLLLELCFAALLTAGQAPPRRASLVLYGQENPNLAHVSQVLVDEDYRNTLIPTCKNNEVRQF